MWHFDDSKVSHESNNIVARMAEWIFFNEITFEVGSSKMNVSRGKIHEYLGMKMVFSVQVKVIITMITYIG